MRIDLTLEVGGPHQPLEEERHRVVVSPDLRCLGVARRDRVHEVLVRTQRPRLHELGNADLVVDRSAKLLVAAPLDTRRVVGRRASEGDEREALE